MNGSGNAGFVDAFEKNKRKMGLIIRSSSHLHFLFYCHNEARGCPQFCHPRKHLQYRM